jgi:predicted transposase/invertase (TIGR01784 family)
MLIDEYPDELIDIRATLDFVVKMLIGDERFLDSPKHFVNAVLQWQCPLVEIYLEPTIDNKEFDDDKITIFDIVAKDASGRIFNIEIQRLVRFWLPGRVTYYAASHLVGQLREGDDYTRLRPVICICILEETLFRDLLDYHNEFRMRTESGFEFSDLIQIHVLELPKYVARSDNKLITDPLEQWLYFFRNAHSSTPRQLLGRLADPIFRELVETLLMIKRNPDMRYSYEMRLKAERDEQAKLSSAKLEGHEEGREEGREEGLEEGERLGLVRLAQTLQQLLTTSDCDQAEFQAMNSNELEKAIEELQSKLRNRG